jgi:SAM-dependent methyltransferase
MPDLDVNENSDIYYQGEYWNDLDHVAAMINRRISGDPAVSWFEHFGRATGRTFERALILNCGNGWAERELLATGLIREAVGIDYSEDLLAQARAAATEGDLPLRYEQTNINTGVLPDVSFDLVVNHAAAHHIAAIDRVFREVCRILPEDGWFVSYDYVGPHRNQYAPDAWETAWSLNQQMPEVLRQDMLYPHLPTMLVTDPTEAIHSELIIDTFERYFTVRELTPVGGAVAYPLLTHNKALFGVLDAPETVEWVDRILTADDQFLVTHPGSTLFAYFAGTPDKSVLGQTDTLAHWEAEEVERERRAAENGGEYYERGALSSAVIALEDARLEHTRSSARMAALEAEVAALRADPLYAAVSRVADSSLTRRIRHTRAARAAEHRVRAAFGRGPG